jgi:hypothetical protein
MLVASNAVLAEQNLLEGAAKQAVQNKATEVAPDAAKKVVATNQALDKAKSLKGPLKMPQVHFKNKRKK